MFLLKRDPNTPIIDFGPALDLLASGKTDEARMFISETIEYADPNEVVFAKNLEQYLNHDSEFAEEVISLLELHNSQASEIESKPKPATATTPNPVSNPTLIQQIPISNPIPTQLTSDSIKDKLELAVAIQDVLKQDNFINTHSQLLKDKVSNFLQIELKRLFGEEVKEELSQNEIKALKLLAKRLL